MLIDIGLHAGTDVVLLIKLCDLIKGHIRVKRHEVLLKSLI